MSIQANVTNQQITASVGETKIDVSVSGGVGPTGPAGPAGGGYTLPTATDSVLGGVTFGVTAGTACQGNDARLTDAREWSASTVSQADAEAGSSTNRFAFTPLRVFQAIAAWWAGSAAKTKLDGIASGATANATDAQLLSRANHTGTQLASTISDFTTAVVAAAPPTTNASLLTSGTLPDARLSANIARTSDVSAAQAAAASDATTKANAAQAAAVQRANHTGTQASSTISDFSTAAAAAAPVQSVAGRTGTVTLAKGDVGLSNVDNTSDAAKPISTATQTALDGKAALSHAHTVTDISGLATVATSGSAADLTGTLNAARLPATAVTAGSYGSASSVATFTVDAAGRLTAAGSTAIAISAGAVSGLAAVATSGAYSSLTGTPTTLPPTDGSVTDAKITSGGLSASSINWVAIADWQPSTAYAKGALVNYLGVAYRRSAAGTSGTTFSVSNWQQVTPSTFVEAQLPVTIHPFLLAGM